MKLVTPTVMTAGAACVISPDGSDRIPPELWAEYAALVLLEPEPELLAKWTRNLEDSLGVRDVHRAYVEGGEEAARAFVGKGRRERIRWDSPGRPWKLLRVSPNMERRVCEALKEAGLSVYAPIEKYRPPNHWRARTRPLIPSYLFADLPDDAALDLARANHAVREVMCREGRPVEVRAIDIASLILAEANGAFDRTWKPRVIRQRQRKGRKGTVVESRWKSGQRVRVAEGPFAAFIGQIIDVRRESRMGVLLSVFGRATEVEIDEDWLEELDPPLT